LLDGIDVAPGIRACPRGEVERTTCRSQQRKHGEAAITAKHGNLLERLLPPRIQGGRLSGVLLIGAGLCFLLL